MTRYAAGQFCLAFAVTAVGTLRMFRLLVDEIDDTISRATGLR